jgi:signal transduction histidine kinase
MALQLHQRRCEAPHDDKSLSVALRQLSLTETQVRGLLSLGRTERSQPALCCTRQIVEEVASLVEPICEHAGVTLERDLNTAGNPDPAYQVRADLESLRAAVLNLVTNAIEAAGPAGRVTLRTLHDEATVGIEIGDDGAGPPARVAETLFEPFVTSKPEGVGLGLALARQVAVDHGGTLTWRREGERTVFRFMLPTVDEAREVNEQSMTASAKSEMRNAKCEIASTHGAPPVGLATN